MNIGLVGDLDLDSLLSLNHVRESLGDAFFISDFNPFNSIHLFLKHLEEDPHHSAPHIPNLVDITISSGSCEG